MIYRKIGHDYHGYFKAKYYFNIVKGLLFPSTKCISTMAYTYMYMYSGSIAFLLHYQTSIIVSLLLYRFFIIRVQGTIV